MVAEPPQHHYSRDDYQYKLINNIRVLLVRRFIEIASWGSTG